MPSFLASHRPEPVLVTGGTGLLGRHVVQALRAAGDDVRLLARDPGSVAAGCEVVAGDVGDRVAVRSALRSVRAVYHLAAVTEKWRRDPGEFERVNVDAAVELARAAAECGVERVVHVSSFTVFGPSGATGAASASGSEGVVDERAVAPTANLQNDYQRSKHRAHVRLAELAANGSAPVVIACPGVVYGTGTAAARNPIADLVQRQVSGRLRGFPALDRRWTLAWAPDVARGLLLLRQRGRVGESYLLGGPVASLRELCAQVGAWAGRAVPRDLPLAPLLALGRCAELAARISHARRSPRLSAAALRFLRHDWVFRSAKAIALGYECTPLRDGLLALWSDLHARQLVDHAPPAAVPAA
ncbi:MAG: NAD-dependent epimerase/dehydratase family protein [Planctomycetes bacterium]|nr:NAD-dependent epimerase/dehydratase family protein [Planctomycetota bacterium]